MVPDTPSSTLRLILNSPDDHHDAEGEKPILLKAIELILAKPESIRSEALHTREKYQKRFRGERTDHEIAEMAANKIISKYSYYAAFSGGATALTSVVPGLGTVIATFGGAIADTALCMKYQIEMVMALATIYDHDIRQDEEQRLCFIVAALGSIAEAAKAGAKEVASKAFVAMAREYLKGATLATVKALFKRVFVTFSRKALEKAAPFGIAVFVSFGANKVLTRYVGSKAKDFFAANECV